jgi:hypothetical protein
MDRRTSHKAKISLKHYFPLVLVLFTILPGLPAGAEDFGLIQGKTLMPDGTAISDVAILISSEDNDFRVTFTSDISGSFVLTGLIAGSYSIRFESAGYHPTVQTNVYVLPSQSLFIKTVLTREESKDLSFSEVIRTDFNQNLQQTILDRINLSVLPSAHNVWALLENQDLSATSNRIDVGGLWNNIPAVFSARGGGSWTQTSYYLNGFDMTDPYHTGIPLFYPDYYALGYTQLYNAGHPPYILTPGGQFNLITQAERSTFHGGISAFYTQRSLQASNISPKLEEEGIFEAHTFDYLLDGNLYLTGPLIKDKLSFFVSVSANDLSRDMAEFDEMDKSSLLSGLVSLRYNFNQNFIRVLWTGQKISYASYGANRKIPFFSTSNRKDAYDVFQAFWNARIHNRHFFKVGFNYVYGHIQSDLQEDALGPHLVEIFKRIPSGPAALAYKDTRKTIAFQARGDSIFEDLFLGDHRFQYGLQLQKSQSRSQKSIQENMHLHFYENDPLEIVKFNTPVEHDETSLQFNFYIQDTLTFSSLLSLYIGLNFDYSRGWIPGNGQDSPSQVVSSKESRVQWFSMAPRLGIIIPLSPSKQSTLKISFARYYFRLPLNYLTYGNPGALGGMVYEWNDRNNDGRFQENETGKLLRREGPLYSSIDPDLERPYTNEYAIVFNSAFGSDWIFSLGGFYRGTKNQVKTLNIGVPFSSYDSQYILDLGDDSIPKTEDDQIFTVYNQWVDTFGQDFFLLTNHPDDPRVSHYFGVDLNLIKRFGPTFTFFLSMTATQAEGSSNPGNTEWENDDGVIGTLYDNPNTLINTKGRLRFDRAYTIRIGLYYLAPYDINLGCIIKYYDGQPFSRKIIVDDFNQGPFYIQAHSRGAVRYEFSLTLDLRIEKAFPIGSSKLRLILDGFNILNSGLATEENQWTGPEFKLRYATEIQSPRVFRLGLAFEF